MSCYFEIFFHKNVQERGDVKSKDIRRGRTERQEELCYPRESYYLVETPYHISNFSDFILVKAVCLPRGHLSTQPK